MLVSSGRQRRKALWCSESRANRDRTELTCDKTHVGGTVFMNQHFAN